LSERKFKITINGKTFIVSVEEIDSDEKATITGVKGIGVKQVKQKKPSSIPKIISKKTIDRGSENGVVRAPIPGVILSIDVKIGDEVEEGSRLLVLEAMKMENEILSPVKGSVKEIRVTARDRVEKEEVLVVIE
jgi:biotin carboxyl carrier protein